MGEQPMEFYLSFDQLLGKIGNPVILIFVPLFLVATLLEALLIMRRQGAYPWQNAGLSSGMAIGHFITQAATHGLTFGIIATSVYEVRLTTIPISFHHWPSLIALFLLADLGFYVEHRCSHRVRLLWASHSVHHSSEKMLATTAYRLSWTPILSGVFLFYLPIVWIGYDPA
jgi:sterol desaturase/sphingolipid hydroxylase (fatty acid hydroxylase superfamily)